MKAWLVIFLFGLVLPLWAQKVTPEAIEKRANKLFDAKQYTEAFKDYNDLTKLEPNNPRFHLNAGVCLLNSPFPEKALPYIQKGVSLQKEPASDDWYVLAQAQHANYLFDEAIDNYKKSDPKGSKRAVIARRITECVNGKRLKGAPVAAIVLNLGPTINTSAHEYLPFVTADQQMLFFTSRRKNTTGGALAEDGLPFEDIYLCRNQNGTWGGVVQMGSPINSRDNDACIGLNESGRTMFIYKGKNGGDIYTSEFNGKTWSKPEPFKFNTPALETSACLSPDGKQLFFVSDRGGNKDIYICRKMPRGNSWFPPQKMNGNINTSEDEESPFIHADGQTLYFSSKGHATMGGYDIFKANLNTKGVFSSPENLGYPINSVGDDLYFSLSADAKNGYFSSEKSTGFGGQDLYTIKMPPPALPVGVALFQGTVVDEQTGKPTIAKVTITDNEANQVITTTETDETDGKFVVTLPSGRNYGITVEKDGRLFYSDNVDFKAEDGFKSLNKKITLPTIAKGNKLILRNMFYMVKSHLLQPASIPELEKVVVFLNKNPKVKVEIGGHTDNTGSEEANLALSKKRADEVRNWLIEAGVKANRLQAKGYSSTKPLASNTTEDGKAQNRRTEILILE
jgi:outer membrane protein OmpA-like peptidoglycan-associated protein